MFIKMPQRLLWTKIIMKISISRESMTTSFRLPPARRPPEVKVPTRQDVHGRWADVLHWARMKVFRTSLFVPDEEKTLDGRRVRIGRAKYVPRTSGRKRTSGKLSYGPKVGRPLNVTSICDVLWTTLAEWVSIPAGEALRLHKIKAYSP